MDKITNVINTFGKNKCTLLEDELKHNSICDICDTNFNMLLNEDISQYEINSHVWLSTLPPCTHFL